MPKIAGELIAAALDSDMSCAWVLAETAYGSKYRQRRMLKERDQPHVLAVRSNHCLRLLYGDWRFEQTDSARMAGALGPEDWTTHAAGEGAKRWRL